MFEETTKTLLGLLSGKDFEKVPAATTDIIKYLDQLTEKISSLEDDAAAKLNAFSYQRIDCKGRDTQLLRDLADARQKAKEYAYKVSELIQYGSDETRQENIRQGLKNRDLTPLTNYINQLQRRLLMCEESYQGAQEAINQLVSESQEMVGFCEKKAFEANTKRKTAMAVSVAAGVVGLAAIVGMFIFGVQPDMVPITGIAFMVCGGAAFRASSYYVTNLDEVEKQFKQLGRSFSDTQSHVLSIEEDIKVVKMWLTKIAYAVNNANYNPADVHSEFVKAFGCLCQTFSQSRKASILQEKLMKILT